MRVVDIAEATTHLPRLVEGAVQGEPFIIGRDGKPLVKVIALDAPGPREKRKLGSLAGQIVVPEYFDQIGAAEIADLFEAEG